MEKRLLLDDLVYHGSLVVFHRNQLDRRADNMALNDTALYHLINVGVRDMDTIDKPWDASTRSMRYAACLGDRLWSNSGSSHCIPDLPPALQLSSSPCALSLDPDPTLALSIR